MRPTNAPQSTLFAPLTHALGTEARVRILRVLAEGEPARSRTIPALARETALNERGVRTVVDELELLGALERSEGTPRRVVLRQRWPLAAALKALFEAEHAYRRGLVAALRQAAEQLAPAPMGVWVAGAHAAGADRAGEPLELVVLRRIEAPAETVRARLRQALEPVMAQYDLPVPEVHVLSRGDLAVAPEEPTIQRLLAAPRLLLAGVMPGASHGAIEPARPGAPTHAGRDAESRARAAAYAKLLRREPTLAERAAAALRARLPNASPRLRPTLEEWLALLAEPPARLAKLLERDDERMTRLRQSLPFGEVLTEAERAQVTRWTAGRSA